MEPVDVMEKLEKINGVFRSIPTSFSSTFDEFNNYTKLVSKSKCIHSRNVFSGKNLSLIQTMLKNMDSSFLARKVMGSTGEWETRDNYLEHITKLLTFRQDAFISEELFGYFNNYFMKEVSTRAISTERRKLRELLLYRKYNKLCDEMNNMRLFPLPLKKYNEFVVEMYERKRRPKFGKKIISGVYFQAPVTKYYRSRWGVGTLKYRYVGVQIVSPDSKNTKANIRLCVK
jgi:hypothetical protein